MFFTNTKLSFYKKLLSDLHLLAGHRQNGEDDKHPHQLSPPLPEGGYKGF